MYYGGSCHSVAEIGAGIEQSTIIGCNSNNRCHSEGVVSGVIVRGMKVIPL